MTTTDPQNPPDDSAEAPGGGRCALAACSLPASSVQRLVAQWSSAAAAAIDRRDFGRAAQYEAMLTDMFMELALTSTEPATRDVLAVAANVAARVAAAHADDDAIAGTFEAVHRSLNARAEMASATERQPEENK